MTNEAEQTGPADLPAEAAAVGACMLDGAVAVPLASAILRASDFTDVRLAVMFSGLCGLSRDGLAVDMIGLRNRMQADGTWAKLGDDPLGWFERVSSTVPSAANVEYYAHIVADAARARAVAQATSIATARLMDGRTWRSPSAVDDAVASITQASVRDGEPRASLAEDLAAVMDEMGIHGVEIPTGIERVDKAYGGLHAGELVILAALTSHGKSSLCLQVASTVADQRPVLFVSCEMSRKEMLWRLLAQTTGHPLDDLRRGTAYQFNPKQIDAARDRILTTPLEMLSGSKVRPLDVRAAAMRLKREFGDLGLIVVDYIQRMRGDRRSYSTRQAEIEDVSDALKDAAMESGCAVIAAAQFNRGANEGGGRPRMHQLRDSGRLEQDADAVWILHWDDAVAKRLPQAELLPAELHIDKARNGIAGVYAALKFERPTTTFWEDLDDHTTERVGRRRSVDGVS